MGPENLRDFPNDPLSKQIKLEETHCLQTLADITAPESLRILCIESAILHFIPDLSRKKTLKKFPQKSYHVCPRRFLFATHRQDERALEEIVPGSEADGCSSCSLGKSLRRLERTLSVVGAADEGRFRAVRGCSFVGAADEADDIGGARHK